MEAKEWKQVECCECGKKVTYHDRPISTTMGPLCQECRGTLYPRPQVESDHADD